MTVYIIWQNEMEKPEDSKRPVSCSSFRPAPDSRLGQEPESGRTGLCAGRPHVAGRDAGATPRIESGVTVAFPK
jgi:hypothetical protein